MEIKVGDESLEYIWYIIAALGAGVGTGLAGLSAATVMVPILIVLCPSFSGEASAYQATAIALVSDILGSAVASVTYAKHKNIDLNADMYCCRNGGVALLSTVCQSGQQSHCRSCDGSCPNCHGRSADRPSLLGNC